MRELTWKVLFRLNAIKTVCQSEGLYSYARLTTKVRGNVSLIDKWSKADMALCNGVDLVIELPTVYSISSAENFAYGAIKILNSLKIVDTLSFGSEFCDLDVLEKIADVLGV